MNISHTHARKGNVTRTYRAWQNMKRRCYAPSTIRFERWGGRGIKVCEQWKDSFSTFLKDMGECPKDGTLDRIDNDGNYGPYNCRWATRIQQGKNKRNTRFLTFKGETKNLTDWANTIGIDKRTLWNRLKLGWSIERALTESL